MRFFAAFALFVLWLVLSASYNVLHMATGAVVASMVVWLSPTAAPHLRQFSWWAALMYVPWLIVRILKSGFHVSRLILDPALPIAPELIQHKTKLSSDGELVVLGNSITLTPGTITVEVAPGELIVHALDAPSCVELKSGLFDERVGRLFSVKEDQK
ncbi:MAG: Na+/H+ antiporter subunit E [Gammaproteobacteria bacterium]|jgi:multicomponent Na+:H+ antiporter subunit E|nr:Na+/H+ antiporter subunit E [Gammaproteobacteria bacterium]